MRDGVDLALRFEAAVSATAADLAVRSWMGTEVPDVSRLWRGVRRWRVNDFERYLVYYLPIEEGVDVVRVVHSARDRSLLRE